MHHPCSSFPHPLMPKIRMAGFKILGVGGGGSILKKLQNTLAAA